jgi:hypothetical protein
MIDMIKIFLTKWKQTKWPLLRTVWTISQCMFLIISQSKAYQTFQIKSIIKMCTLKANRIQN